MNQNIQQQSRKYRTPKILTIGDFTIKTEVCQYMSITRGIVTSTEMTGNWPTDGYMLPFVPKRLPNGIPFWAYVTGIL